MTKTQVMHHLNNPVSWHDLFEKHGKEINFVGVIITNENVYLADKERSSNWSAKLCWVIRIRWCYSNSRRISVTQILTLIMNCKKIEEKGIKTVIVTDEYAGRDGKSQSLADADALANAVVTGGNANEVSYSSSNG